MVDVLCGVLRECWYAKPWPSKASLIASVKTLGKRLQGLFQDDTGTTPDLQRELIDGWARAAVEIAPHQSALVHDWLTRRLAHVDAGRSHLTVGHEDLAAWPRSGESGAEQREPTVRRPRQ